MLNFLIPLFPHSPSTDNLISYFISKIEMISPKLTTSLLKFPVFTGSESDPPATQPLKPATGLSMPRPKEELDERTSGRKVSAN